MSGRKIALSKTGGKAASHGFFVLPDKYPAVSVIRLPSTISATPNADTMLDIAQPIVRPGVTYGTSDGKIVSASAGRN